LISQAYLLALQPHVKISFENVTLKTVNKEKQALSVLETLERFNLQIVALLKVTHLDKDQIDHISVTYQCEKGHHVVSYAFVRDIDYL